MHSVGDRRRQWAILDPVLADPAALHLMQQILDQVNSDWTHDAQLDLDVTHAHQLLSYHRIASLIPIDRLPYPQKAKLREWQIVIAAAQLKLRSVAIEVLELLATAGIETRVLKGLATSELDYPNRVLRHTGDVDLAVRAEQMDQAVRLLQAHGYRDHPQPFSPYLMYATTLDAPTGVEVDLHTRLFRHSPTSDRLFDHPGEPLVDLPGRALCASHRIVHAAGHLIVSPPGIRRMSGLFDVARIHHHPKLDLGAARDFAAALGVEALVGAALRLEAVLSDRTEVVEALESWRQPNWLERKIKLTPQRHLVLEHLGRYREIQRGDRLLYLPTWLLPDRRQRQLLIDSARATRDRLWAGIDNVVGPRPENEAPQGRPTAGEGDEAAVPMGIAHVNRQGGAVQYRLGDAVLMRSERFGAAALEKVAADDSMTGTLLHSYAARIDRNSADPQWLVLRKLVSERVAAQALPQPEVGDLVVHLRLGNGKGFDRADETPEQFVRYVVDLAAAEHTTRIALVTAIHFGASHLRRHDRDGQIERENRRARDIARQIMDQLRDAGLDVRLHSHEDIDRDFCFLAGATRLVLGNGHFSLCAAMVSDATVFTPPWSRPGTHVDIDSMLASRDSTASPEP